MAKYHEQEKLRTTYTRTHVIRKKEFPKLFFSLSLFTSFEMAKFGSMNELMEERRRRNLEGGDGLEKGGEERMAE